MDSTFVSITYLVITILVENGMCQLGELFSSLASNPQALQQMMGKGGMGGGMPAGMNGIDGLSGMGGMTPTVGGGAVDPNMMVAIMDPNTLPMMDPAMFTQLQQLQDTQTTDTSVTSSIPNQPVYNITLIDPGMLPAKKPFQTSQLQRAQPQAQNEAFGQDQSMFSTMSRGSSNNKLTVSQNNGGNVKRKSLTGSLKNNIPPKHILELAKEGIGASPMVQNRLCPTKQCPFPLPCAVPVKTYTPQSFFVCPECPKCPGEVLEGVSTYLGKVVRIARKSTGMSVNTENWVYDTQGNQQCVSSDESTDGIYHLEC